MQGEKAKRRDPRRYRYSGTACPDFRKVRGRHTMLLAGLQLCKLHTKLRIKPVPPPLDTAVAVSRR